MDVTAESSIFYTEGVTKKYNLTVANKDISVFVPRGKITGFVGENGSGKTTFLRLLTKLSFPTAGSFHFTSEDGKCRMGAIVESPALHPSMTAEDNLRFQAKLCKADESKIPDLLKEVGLSDTGKKKAKHFSLGMRQRLGIAIALLSDPELLILDEPTNGLDPQGMIELRTFLKRLCEERNMTLIVSSHILSELSLLADYYLFIHRGEIIKTAYATELFSDLSKRLIVTLSSDPSDFIKEITENGWASGCEMSEGKLVLIAPYDLPKLLGGLSKLDVTDIETLDETLETRYLSIMNGGEPQ